MPLHMFTRYTWFMVGDEVRICFLGRLVVRGSTFGLSIPVLFSSFPFSWNFNFICNLFDFVIEDKELLVFSLSHLHTSPFAPDVRA